MTVALADMKRYRPQLSDDTGSNGGRMTAVAVPTTAQNGVWPQAPSTELLAGSNKFRKGFFKIENADNQPAYNARVLLEKPTPGDDLLFLIAATQTNTQGDLTGSEALYGAGVLDDDASAGASSIDVLVEDWANYPIFRNGDWIAIHTGTGEFEWHQLDATPSADGNVITLSIAGTLAASYTAGASWVSSGIHQDELAATVDTPTIISAAGTFDESLVVCNYKGAIEQVLTLDFTSATAFTCTSDVAGSLGAGNNLADFAPVNADFGVEYCTIPVAAWEGSTWANGDRLVLTLHPAAVPYFERRVIPAASNSIASQTRIATLYVES